MPFQTGNIVTPGNSPYVQIFNKYIKSFFSENICLNSNTLKFYFLIICSDKLKVYLTPIFPSYYS